MNRPRPANHTAWDHPWVAQHRQRYKLDAQGQVYAVTFQPGTPQVEYWTDVMGLNHSSSSAQQDLWPAMTEAMVWWLRMADIDGFRCDVASLVPTPFWEQARVALERVKPVFMLANGQHGGVLQWLDTGGNGRVVSFARALGSSRVSVAVNLAADTQAYTAANGSPASLPGWAWAVTTT